MSLKKIIKKATLCSLSLLVVSTVNAEPNAVTNNTIIGTAPQISDALYSAIDKKESLPFLGIATDENNYFSTNDLENKLKTLDLDLHQETPNSLLLKLNSKGVAFGTLADGDAVDIDGDGEFYIESISDDKNKVAWFYTPILKDGIVSSNSQELTDYQLKQSFCDLAQQNIYPFIQVSAPFNLLTTYGDPYYTPYDKDDDKSPLSKLGTPVNPVNKINFHYPQVCYVRIPTSTDMIQDYTLGNPDFSREYHYKINKGGRTFPTTGSNNNLFTLVIAGIDQKISGWDITTSSNTQLVPFVDTNLTYPNQNPYWATFRLKGPNAVDLGAIYPTPVTVPSSDFLNKEITLKPIDASNSLIDQATYKFTINKWFSSITTTQKLAQKITVEEATDYCSKSGNYQLADIRDLTNADADFDGVPAQDPSSQYNPQNKNSFSYSIGGGLIAEWSFYGYSMAGEPISTQSGATVTTDPNLVVAFSTGQIMERTSAMKIVNLMCVDK